MKPYGCVTGPFFLLVISALLAGVGGCGRPTGDTADAPAAGKQAAGTPSDAGMASAPAAPADAEPAAPHREASDGSTEAADELPANITLTTAKEIRKLIEAGRGKAVVVNFWATWCPPCVKEMPELARFYNEYKDKHVQFLSFSADHPSTTQSAVVPFVTSYELPFPVHVMALDNPDELIEELPLDWDGALPATFVFAPDGTIAKSWVGAITFDELVEAVRETQSEASSTSG